MRQGVQLAQQRGFAAWAQGQGAQVFRLCPDALGSIARPATLFKVEHGTHGPSLRIDSPLFGEGEGAVQGGMQGGATQDWR
ncbi:hypothetical protein D3C80_1738190 [compost metagenome]